MRILYIEDDETFVRVMRAVAKLGGYELLVATSAGEGWQMTQEYASTLDIILTDIDLPDYDGLTLTRQIRARMPTIPIIAISSYLPKDMREPALMAGCTDFISKPIDISSEFAATLACYVQNRDQQS